MIREQRLARAFVQMADTLVAGFDVIEFLQSLTDRTVELLDADASGLMLRDHHGDLRVMATSSEAAHLLEIFQLQNDEGPCRDCFRSGQPVVNVTIEAAAQRWPSFTPVMRESGFSAVHAVPMRLRGEILGALNLFHVGDNPLTESALQIGQALADVATIGLIQERGLRERELLAEQLQGALNSRILIEQAKGVLAERQSVSVDEAFRRLRSHARRNGARLADVAEAVITRRLDVS
jgi:transcriptional regulator with GAF, ATPase, and Fis domain